LRGCTGCVVRGPSFQEPGIQEVKRSVERVRAAPRDRALAAPPLLPGA